ncbi:MAG: hypothetical protein ACRCT1_10575 [Microcoleaceae cyanobacterium]
MNDITLAVFLANLEPALALLLKDYTGSPIALLSEIVLAMKKSQDIVNEGLAEELPKFNIINEFAFSNPTPEEGKWVQLQSIGIRIKYDLQQSAPTAFKVK